jgi:SAM-dependent methyltransferase
MPTPGGRSPELGRCPRRADARVEYHFFLIPTAWFRRRRMARFVRELAITAETRVLDVGGTPETWDLAGVRPRVTLLNTPRTRGELADAAAWVAGDGRALPFRDRAFDVVFSNSVIEHVGDAASQLRFAREVMRVGRAFWVQTPNRAFPLEQHLLTPFVHWLPRAWQRRIVPRFTVWSALVHPTADRREFYLRHYLEEVRLLAAADLRALFPGARLIRERFCGWTKSLIAVSQQPERHLD